ncbi:hypothetical protein ACM66B_004052 [Microbotryomycetes sp. NB124-2]
MNDDATHINRMLSLPSELVLRILSCGALDAVDVTRFKQSCKPAKDFVETTAALWRQLFLNEFDGQDEREYWLEGCVRTPAWSWYNTELVERTRARLQAQRIVAASDDRGRDVLELDEVAIDALVRIAETRRVLDDGGDGKESANQRWLSQHLGNDFVRRVELSPHRVTRSVTRMLHMDASNSSRLRALAHLHVLQTPTTLTIQQHRLDAREIVYESRSVEQSRHWGPFLPADETNGTYFVDWTKLEALTIVMAANLRDAIVFGWGAEYGIDSTWDVPHGWESTMRVKPPRQAGNDGQEDRGSEKASRDWAGVEDMVWRGTYGFLDYRVFSHFNFHRTEGVTPSLLGEDEAVGDCMSLDIKLLPPGQVPMPPDHPENAFLSEGDDDQDFEDDDDDDSDASTIGSEGFESDSSFIRRAHEGNMLGIGTSAGTSTRQSTGEVETPADRTPRAFSADSQVDHEATKNVMSDHRRVRKLARLSKPARAVSEDDTRVQTPPRHEIALSSTPESLPTQPLHEPLHFSGGFGGVRHAGALHRSVRGTVKMTSDGHVHWRYIIRYAGRDQWLMNGVQIGGVRSKYGIVGWWTAADHEDESPCGPFWYFQHRAREPDASSPLA